MKENDGDILSYISRRLILQGSMTPSPGLMDGKMGIILFFYHYSRYTGKTHCDTFAGELVNEVCDMIMQYGSTDFGNGVCGMGWAVLHLIEYGFIDGDTGSFFEKIDRRIMEKDIRRVTDTGLYTGLAGIAHYAVQRKKMDRRYLTELFHQMDATLVESISSCPSGQLLCEIVNETDSGTDIRNIASFGLNGLAGAGLKLMLPHLNFPQIPSTPNLPQS